MNINVGKKRRVRFYSLGCRVNQYEADVLADVFSSRGYEVCDDDDCDVCVVNTCSVTAESDRKSGQILRRAAAANPRAIIVATGCFAQLRPHDAAAIKGVSLVVGNDRKTRIPELADRLLSGALTAPYIDVGDINSAAALEAMTLTAPRKSRAHIKIVDGCDSKCAYCIIPAARGRIRSKPPEDIVAEVRAVAASGCREVVLTGIETSAYGRDLKSIGLVELVRAVACVDGIERIRFGSLDPAAVTPRFIDALAEIPSVMPHFHLSMQSGCDRTLNAMRRRYVTGTVSENIAHLRSVMPNVTLGADVMTGFPGETDEDFAESLDFFRRERFAFTHVFTYSKRAGTEAASMPDQIPEKIKNERSAALIKQTQLIRAEMLDKYIAETQVTKVLFETLKDGVVHGHTPEFFELSARSDKPLDGEIIAVEPAGRDGDTIWGIIK